MSDELVEQTQHAYQLHEESLMTVSQMPQHGIWACLISESQFGLHYVCRDIDWWQGSVRVLGNGWWFLHCLDMLGFCYRGTDAIRSSVLPYKMVVVCKWMLLRKGKGVNHPGSLENFMVMMKSGKCVINEVKVSFWDDILVYKVTEL